MKKVLFAFGAMVVMAACSTPPSESAEDELSKIVKKNQIESVDHSKPKKRPGDN